MPAKIGANIRQNFTFEIGKNATTQITMSL